MIPTHFLSSQAGSGSDTHCLSGSALSNATTSADVTAENNCNTEPTGAEVTQCVCVSSGSSYSCDLVIEKNCAGPTR